MLQEAQESNNNWREHWFVVNVLVEIPIIGSFFKNITLTSSIHDAGKCIAAMAGGTAAMIAILDPTETENISMDIAKMTASMIIGTASGKVIYNGFCNSSVILYQYLRSEPISSSRMANDDIEMQRITTDADHENTVRTSNFFKPVQSYRE